MPLPCRRSLVACLAISLAPSVPALATSAGRIRARGLSPGAHGVDVAALQRCLGQVGLRARVDGHYGSATVRAVQAFQRAARLRPTGAVGPDTARALRRACGGSAAQANGGLEPGDTGRAHSLGDRIPLRPGMSGHDVRILQDFLRKTGFKTSVDGEFGAQTERAQRAFEKALELPIDGVVDAADINALRAAVSGGDVPAAAPPPLAPGDRATITSDGLAAAPQSAPPVVQQIIAAGNAIAHKPYRYGGGHGRWNDTGYDCSGSVSYALHGGGLLDTQLDSTQFESWGDPGPGQWVTIYANSGHAYMIVAGLRFDTSGAQQDGSRWHTATRSARGYVVRHPTGL